MLNGTQITIVGNLGGDPELRYTATGQPVCSLNVAVPIRKKDAATGRYADAGTTWYRVTVWGYLGEHCAESLIRGMRVLAVGSLVSRSWEDREGNKRESWEVTADAIGPDLTYATAKVIRATREGAPGPADSDDPWASQGGSPIEPAGKPA